MCIGNIYKIPMNEKDGITPKGGYDNRDKFIIIVGKNNPNDYYGVVVVNSKINILFADYNFQYELKHDKYTGILKENSYVDCTSIKRVIKERVIDSLGKIDDSDFESIVKKLKIHPNISKHELRKYNIV